MKTCETCKHFDPLPKRTETQWGNCRNDNLEKVLESEYVEVTSNFGCVLHEPKDA